MAAAGHQSKDIMKMFEGPSEDTLSQDKQRLVQLVREAFKEMGKLLKNVALYGRHHQSVDRFMEKFFRLISDALKGLEEFSIETKAYQLMLHDLPVYQNPSIENNFVYKFYMDGVRRLTFYAGITQDELDRFVSILLVNWDSPALFEDDCVTLLWNEDFQFIRHTVTDSFQEDSKRGQEHLYTIPGVIQQVRQGAEGTLDKDQKIDGGAAGRGQGGGLTSRKGMGRAHKIAIKIPADTTISEEDLSYFEEQPFAMDEVEFDMLRALINTTGRETLEKFIEILFKVNLDKDEEEEQKARIVGIFDRISDLLLETRRLGDLERLLRQIHHLTGPEGQELPENIEAIQRIFSHWSEPPFVIKVMAELSYPKSRYTPSVLAICELLNPEAVQEITRQVSKVKIPSRRFAIFKLLPKIIKGQEQRVARLFDEFDAGFAHEMFKLLKESGDKHAFMIALRSSMKNQDPDVRFEGLGFMPLEAAGQSVELLMKALKDPAKKVRNKSIHLLARIQSEEIHEKLMVFIEEKHFSRLSLDEKRRVFAAASLTGRSSEAFVTIFKGGGGLMSKPSDDMRHCAAMALGIRLRRDLIPLFEKEVNRRLRANELLVEACKWAIGHMAAEREARTHQLYEIFIQGQLLTGGPQRGA